MKLFRSPVIAAMLFLGLVLPTLADGVIVVEPPTCTPVCSEPTFIDDQLTIRSHRVDVQIADQIATTTIDQVFLNQNDWVAEGTYLFPVPQGATIDEFTMYIEGEPVEANLLPTEEARAIYEEIVRNMLDPALLEYVGRNVIQASIFPIPPGEEREIEIVYQEVLPVEQGLVTYSYPLDTERFSAEPIEQVSLRVEIDSDDPVRAVYSPTHRVAVDRQSDHHIVAGWEDTNTRPDTNFELVYSVSDEAIGANLLSYWNAVDQEGTFMLLAAPGFGAEQSVIAKDVVIVLDSSGSMEGEKIEQAKSALTFVLGQLNTEDRFTVVDFSTGTRMFESELQPVSRATDAMRWVERIEATGGTDINTALLLSMDIVESDRPTYLLFLTDGLPTEGETDISQIIENAEIVAPDNLRLFAFGVGDDVDTVLLDSLAQDHHGATTYVRPGESLDDAIGSLYGKISTPLLTDVEFDIDGAQIEEIYPQPLPDIFADTQLVVVGKYREGGPVTISLTGNVDDERTTFFYEGQSLASATGESDTNTLPRLWATRKIGYLLNQIRLHGENQEWIQAIIDLSVRYGIVTPYTSYLITEEDVLSVAGREELAEAEYAQAVEIDSSTSGEDAVDAAAAAGSLQDADAAAPVDSSIISADAAVKIVGSRAFLNQDGIWIETTFDPDTMATIKIEFASDEYFDLIAKHPGLAEAFALGDRVIALSDGVAYEVVV